MSRSKHILVTGGAGFIGSNLVAALCERELAVVVCDSLGKGDKWRNLAMHELVNYVAPAQLMDYLATGPPLDAVFHMGAISSTSEIDGDLVMSSNFVLTRALWTWCAEHVVRFIYASSAATYGDGRSGFDDFSTSAELARLRPLNLYGWSKHLFDRFVAREAAQSAPPQWAGLKFFNVYGPNEYHKGSMQSVIAHLYPKLREGQNPRLFKSYNPDYPDGGQLRDFVYVRDCVDVMLWLLNTPGVNGLFNVGSGQARSFADLARALMHGMELDRPIEFVDMPLELRDKYQYFTKASLNRLRSAGFSKEMTSLEQGVRDYVRSYLDGDKYR